MSFCQFDDSAALFDSTPVENMFITEYMLRAPGDFVKVYLYGLMLCYHPSQRMSIASMARDLELTEEEVERAFRYWSRDGLVRRTGDNPVTYAFCNIKQLTLTKAQSPGEQLYNKNFMEEAERILGGRPITVPEHQLMFDWIDVLELPEEVVLMLLQTEMEKSGGRLSFRVADKVAQEWAQSGVKTVEDVEKIVILGREREQQLRRLLARLGQRRAPSEDEKAMYRKWIDEWGFSPEAVSEACRETTKGTPTMAYLDGILLRQHQLGRHEAQMLSAGMDKEHAERDFAREVFAGLGRTGVTPTPEDMSLIEGWRKENSEEMILLAVSAAHRRANGGNLEDVNNWLEKWKRQGLATPEAVRADSARQRMLNGQLREIYDAAGLEKKTNQPDRDLLCRWMGEMGMDMELILLAAQYARSSGAPMLTIGRILADWQRAGISDVEAAKAEHEAHMQGARAAAPRMQASVRTQDVLQRHQYTQEDFSKMVVDLDEEES